MKYAKLLFLAVFLISSVNPAMVWEFGIRVQNSSNQLISAHIYIYGFNSSTRDYDELLYDDNCPATPIDGQLNAIFNVEGISGNYSGALDTLPYRDVYLFVIGTKYSRNTVAWGGSYVDVTMTYTDGVGFGSASAGGQSIGTWTNYNITLKNNMGNDYANGIIHLNSESISTGISGVTRTREASTFPHTIAGEEQTVSDVFRKWRIWSDDNYNLSRQISAGSYNLTANYARQYSANVSTNLGGGVVYVNGSTYNCPTSNSYIYDDLTDNYIAAPNQEYDNFSCTFDHWELDGSFYSSQNQLIFSNPSSGVTLTAIFTKKISNVGEGLTFGTNLNDPIVLYWNDNPNATSYQIWRHVRIDGVWQSDQQIATVNSGVETYTDMDYSLNVWKQGIEIEYDARAVSASYSQDAAWSKVYGSIFAKMNSGLAEGIAIEKETPTNYSIGSFPNPFNPTTTINYQLPKDGMVTIKVYDVLGKEVATLVNEQRSAGYYKVDFDASRMTSGVYICSIQASSFNKSIKLLLTK
jgi:hypothetical protein